MRQIFLDTETSGFSFKDGHRIIEFGGVEAINRKLTGNDLHLYFRPDIEIEKGAFEVHGISNEQLMSELPFEAKVDEIMNYLKGAELVIHNAGFDVPFLDYELNRLPKNHWGTLKEHCQVVDTLIMARKLHPGQRNSLDALCRRYMISNAHRTLHGALLDAQLLAKVYFAMTGGQTQLALTEASEIKKVEDETNKVDLSELKLKLAKLLPASEAAHQSYIELLEKKSTNGVLWQLIEDKNS
ncbi:DNA polymerase III subunit epsilon [Thiotrichales bacterium 19S3-7]|nr:DNA polymerase III subunit epsilon [Thiotrichales bacterium 19S3-7]MCF6801126.1 DNA polymerase III subunit epsilon [Thiotrichales bacterium 19S3-11]